MTETSHKSDIARHLGQSSEYKAIYDPSVLVREPRQSNRTHLDLNDDSLPFVGFDTWNGYEVTALTNNGLPVACICKFVYPCSSKYIVESKSTKLYFNTFSMTQLGNTPSEVYEELRVRAAKDLSDLLETEVYVSIVPNSKALEDISVACEEWDHLQRNNREFVTLEDRFPLENEVFDVYTETPSLLKTNDLLFTIESKYHSSLLRSRCKVTSQPDTGDVYIAFKGTCEVDPVSLLKYIVSFRDECHFHEEICEAIYKRLWDALQPEELVVKCLYARRGSWDINPERASDIKLLHPSLSDSDVLHTKTPRQ